MNAIDEAERVGTWFAIDGNNMLFKDFSTGDRTASRFETRLKLLNRTYHPERIIVGWDPPDGSSFRRDLYAGYKIKRGPKPEGLADAIAAAQAACERECVDSVWSPGFEADDIMATVVNGALMVDRRCVLFSSDKDLRQLLVAGLVTQCIELKRDRDRFNPIWLKADDVKLLYGVEPVQWVDFQTLAGDGGDCVPGVQGIGKVGALDLLDQYGTIDNLLRRSEGKSKSDIGPKERKVLAARDSGTLDVMRQLVTLRSDVPISEAMMQMEVMV